MTEAKEAKWKKFEKLVAEIQKSLVPDAKVIHNDKVIGKKTKTQRQIDISIRQNIGQYNLFIAIDCKDHKIPVDVKDVEEFMGLLDDISANKGAIISASGFTKAAQRRAVDAGIDLYRLIDTDKHDWQTYVSMPVLCDFRRLRRFQFIFRSSEKGPGNIPTVDPAALIIYRENGSIIDTALNILVDNWNKGKLPVEPGIYEDIRLVDTPTCVKDGDTLYRLNIFANIEVEKNLYFGHLPITQIKGFQDQKKWRSNI